MLRTLSDDDLFRNTFRLSVDHEIAHRVFNGTVRVSSRNYRRARFAFQTMSDQVTDELVAIFWAHHPLDCHERLRQDLEPVLEFPDESPGSEELGGPVLLDPSVTP
jgi:hypothetical protein